MTVFEEAIGLPLHDNADPDVRRSVLDSLPVLVFLERSGKIVFANLEARQALGLTEGAWIPRPVEDVLWGLYPGTAEPQTRLVPTRRGSPFHATLPVKDGQLLPVEGTYSVLDAQRREAVIVANPVGCNNAPKPQLMEDVLSCLPEAVAIEHEDHVLYTNPAFTRMFGYTAEEAAGSNLRDLIVPETRYDEHAALGRAVALHDFYSIETVRSGKSGELIDVNLQIAPLILGGARVGCVATYRDIGERKQAEARLQHDAMHDALTGLSNRALFLDRLNQALSRRLRHPEYGCGVLYIDLDNFKSINDGMGHAAGDVLLMSVADRLCTSLRPQDSAARLGGDEFAVLVENILSTSDLEIVVARILREMERPFDIFGHTIKANASIGAAMAGPEHTSSALLLRDADFAMYRAKEAGGGRYEVFDKHLEVCVTSQQEKERELRTALDKRLFVFQYQPMYRLVNGKLEGFESLLRLLRSDGSIQEFDDLLGVADDTGLSVPLGWETLDAACAQLRAWSDQLPEQGFVLTVNLTARQLYHPDLIMHVNKAVEASGADPSRLLFEIPESVLNENPDASVVILQRMADCYVRVVVDDFGSQFAPLNHLVNLPVSMVKLAPRLSGAATTPGRQLAMLESLVRLAHSLGVAVAAQGIETPEQIAALTRIGCTFGQGPFLSSALDSEQAFQLARNGSGAPNLGA